MNKKQLVENIEKAFRDVSLCEGIGIYEAEAIDDCASDEIIENKRERDIRDDWKQIPDDVIDEYYSALSFMDEAGLRFAIPAYMRFAVKFYDISSSPSIDSIIWVLTTQRSWDFLSIEQKQAIAAFICFMVLEADSYIDSYQASLAYEKVWSQYESS